MFDLHKNLKNLIKFGAVHTDNNVFKLHYKVTVILLATFSVLLTSKQYFGDPISCDVESRKEVVDIYCWIHGTFIVESNLNDPHLPGLGVHRYKKGEINDKNPPISRQSYYQWVCLIFGIQAVLFYLPRYFWKACEAGRLKQLVGEFGGPVISDKWTSASKEKIVKHILDGTYANNIYTFRYCFCEVLNFFNVLGNIYFLDWLITGKFSAYGIAHATYKRISPMDKVFPKIAKCTYYKYGVGGSQQPLDALCVLPLNVLNEKVFLILWYWFFILLIISFLCIIYRALFLFIPWFRMYLLRAQVRTFERKKAKYIVSKISFGNFFVLYKFGKNVNPTVHKEVVSCLYDHLVTRGSYKSFIQDV